jgi:hypothetical protein
LMPWYETVAKVEGKVGDSCGMSIFGLDFGP